MDEDDEARGVSSYLTNPVPFSNPRTPSELPVRSDLASIDPVQIAKIRASVAELLVFGFHGMSLNDHARKLLSMGAGGVILFNRNCRDPEQVARLCADLKREAGDRPLLIMVDQEGGYVQRLGPPFTVIPHARVVGNTCDPQAAGAIASVIGKELRAVNIDMNLAPVLDVDTNPENTVIGKRSFGTSPAPVADFGYAFIRSIQREGVAACAKHYPGHGDTLLDSHTHLPLLPHSLTQLLTTEIPPFQKAIEADVAAVMVAHIHTPAFNTTSTTPATMCKDAIDYLRNALLFEGVVLSDCMELGAILQEYTIEEAAVQAVMAGVDMVLVSHSISRQVAVIDSLVHGVLTGRISQERIVDAGMRVGNLKEVYVRAYDKGVIEQELRECEMLQIGCKEHLDIVANVVHQSAVVSGRPVDSQRKWRFKLW